MIKKSFLFVLLTLLFGLEIQSQNIVQSSIDSTSIKIGGQFELTIKALTEKGSTVYFPESESLGSFEVVESLPVDTLEKNDQWEIVKKYSLTQFDAGSYKLPPLPVLIDKKEYLTDEFSVLVQNVEVDTLKQPIYEIKDISTTGAGMSSNWFYYIVILLCVILGIVLYILIKKYQEKNLSEDELYKTPFDKASKKLSKLVNKKEWIRGDVKSYYSDITDIARIFLEETFNIPARELTTYELLTIFRKTLSSNKIPLDKKVVKDFRNIFHTADLVKFAKSQPEEHEIISDTDKINTVIDAINTAYPIAIETLSEQVKVIEKRRRKKLRFRIFIPLSATLLLLTITGGVYLMNNTEAGNFIKTLSFNSSKRLLKGEWISSTYGSPGITVQTPKVLIRLIDPKLQQSLPSGIKNIQQFSSEKMANGIGILLNSINFESGGTFDTDDVLEHTTQIIAQNLNAKGLDYKKEDYENANGIQGIKANGTFLMDNPLTKKEELMKFEIVLLMNKDLAQEIGILYPERDKVGEKIAQKMFDTIEYKTEEK